MSTWLTLGHRPDRAGGATSSSRRGRPCSLLIGAMPRATLACVLCFEGMKAASKPRRGYIRAMDEEDLKGFERKFLRSGEGRELEGSLAQLRMAVLELRPHRGRHHSNPGASSLPEVQRDCLRSGRPRSAIACPGAGVRLRKNKPSGLSYPVLRLPHWKRAVTCNEAPRGAFKIDPLTALPPIVDVVSYCGDGLIPRAHGHHDTTIWASDSVAGHSIALARTHTSKPGAK